MTGFDFAAKYTVEGSARVAYHALGFETTRDEEYEWTGIEVENPDRVRVMMVGDDRVEVVDVEDLTALDDDAYCRECGQIGCTADGRA